jgi:hypothetical protein
VYQQQCCADGATGLRTGGLTSSRLTSLLGGGTWGCVCGRGGRQSCGHQLCGCVSIMQVPTRSVKCSGTPSCTSECFRADALHQQLICKLTPPSPQRCCVRHCQDGSVAVSCCERTCLRVTIPPHMAVQMWDCEDDVQGSVQMTASRQSFGALQVQYVFIDGSITCGSGTATASVLRRCVLPIGFSCLHCCVQPTDCSSWPRAVRASSLTSCDAGARTPSSHSSAASVVCRCCGMRFSMRQHFVVCCVASGA